MPRKDSLSINGLTILSSIFQHFHIAFADLYYQGTESLRFHCTSRLHDLPKEIKDITYNLLQMLFEVFISTILPQRPNAGHFQVLLLYNSFISTVQFQSQPSFLIKRILPAKIFF